MKIADYSIAPGNYHKRTPVTLKKIADILLATILVVDPLMISIPDFAGKEWVVWGWNAFAVLFKFITKMVTDESV
jgi:hypothetical protein